jgi:hypothetical protein
MAQLHLYYLGVWVALGSTLAPLSPLSGSKRHDLENSQPREEAAWLIAVGLSKDVTTAPCPYKR